jgi:shikimate-5-dehydrogenase
MAKNLLDCHELAIFVHGHQNRSSKPIIAIGMGSNGVLSRVTSPITFITHKDMPSLSAPGQITLPETQSILQSIGQLPAQKYYIFGHNISHSLSPTLHNTGFQELGLPYHYDIHQSEQVDKSVEDRINEPDFGGASVTYPHKLQVGRLLDTISPIAELVGAVNTIVSKQTNKGRILIGDNTDWSGIRACLVKGGVKGGNDCSALVIGAGGAARAACYAIQTLNISKIVLVNRTRSKAEATASHFPALRFEIFETLEELCSRGKQSYQIIICCVPADDLGPEKIPSGLFSYQESAVLVEMAYRPPQTGMMKVAARHKGWKVLKGTDVLVEQAYAQFELWTGRRAPVLAMQDAVHRKTKGLM